MKKANIVCALVFMCISVYVVAVTFTFRKFRNVPIGPEFFPKYLGVGLFICSGVLLIQSIKSDDKSESPTINPLNKGIQRTLIGLIIMVLYVLLWPILGFLVVTPLLLFSMMYLLQIRDYKIMLIIAIGVSLGIFLIFKLLLGIEMPLGILTGKINI